MADNEVWGADVPISMPEPPLNKAVIDMGAFGFSVGGMVHQITEQQRDDLALPTFAPLVVP